MITLVASGQTFSLPDTFAWIDETAWDPVTQTITPLLPNEEGEAAIVIQETRLIAGRPITLHGSMHYLMLSSLRAVAVDSPTVLLQMTGLPNKNARFRYESGAAVQFSRIGGPRAIPGPDDWFEGDIRLLEI